MFLKELELYYFRNYIQETLKFSENKVILLGDNAQGKSNLLEAIELLSCLKSHRYSKDIDLVYHQGVYGQIKAKISNCYVDHDLSITIPAKGKRELFVDYEKVKKNLDFLGIINTVLFSTLDLDLVRGAPECRRNWVDSLLIQLEPIYWHIIKDYHHVLKQRNALLKKFKKAGYDHNLPSSADLELQLWNQKLAETASRVKRRRARVITKIQPLARFWHHQISQKTEKLLIKYAPNVLWQEDTPENVQRLIRESLAEKKLAEINLGTTLVGPHRDEIELIINDNLARSYGSQGQQRTLVLALKLAELQIIEQVTGDSPVLLLDDVMAELDLKRQQQLLDCLGDRFQTIITTTHLNCFNENLLHQAQIVKVERGKFNLFIN